METVNATANYDIVLNGFPSESQAETKATDANEHKETEDKPTLPEGHQLGGQESKPSGEQENNNSTNPEVKKSSEQDIKTSSAQEDKMTREQENKISSAQEDISATQDNKNSRPQESKKSRRKALKKSMAQLKKSRVVFDRDGKARRPANITIREEVQIAFNVMAAQRQVKVWILYDRALTEFLAREKEAEAAKATNS